MKSHALRIKENYLTYNYENIGEINEKTFTITCWYGYSRSTG